MTEGQRAGAQVRKASSPTTSSAANASSRLVSFFAPYDSDPTAPRKRCPVCRVRRQHIVEDRQLLGTQYVWKVPSRPPAKVGALSSTGWRRRARLGRCRRRRAGSGRLNRLVLPAPLGPMMANNWLRSTSSETFVRTSLPRSERYLDDGKYDVPVIEGCPDQVGRRAAISAPADLSPQSDQPARHDDQKSQKERFPKRTPCIRRRGAATSGRMVRSRRRDGAGQAPRPPATHIVTSRTETGKRKRPRFT